MTDLVVFPQLLFAGRAPDDEHRDGFLRFDGIIDSFGSFFYAKLARFFGPALPRGCAFGHGSPQGVVHRSHTYRGRFGKDDLCISPGSMCTYRWGFNKYYKVLL